MVRHERSETGSAVTTDLAKPLLRASERHRLIPADTPRSGLRIRRLGVRVPPSAQECPGHWVRDLSIASNRTPLGNPSAIPTGLGQHRLRQREEALALGVRLADDALLFATPEGRPWRPDVCTIGETGSSTDAVLVEPLLDDARTGVRAEAVRALRRLDLVEPDRIAPLLSDPSPTVCKQATIALMPLARQLDMERLRQLLRSQGPSHTRVAAYRLLRARSAWTRLQTNLELLDDESEEFRTRARADILGWIANEAASTYQRPDPEMADELARAIDDRAAVLGPSAVEALRFHAASRRSSGAHRCSLLWSCVGGREIVPGGGHVAARWWPTVLPGGGQLFCPR
jgi:hypothetical protein